MSNYLAIATVTEILKELVQEAIHAISGASVTATRPYSKLDTKAAVNLYLYQVLPNKSLRNMDLPTRKGDGTVIQTPQAALDLSYLFSFYGDEAKQEPQRLLGNVAAALHARPVLETLQIRAVINKIGYLAGSDLDRSAEQIKLSMIPSSLKDSYQLWSAFQVPYVLSINYEARVVLIESEARAAAPSLPVSG